MKLYTFFRSSTSFRLRIALNLKELPYESHYVSLPKMQHREPAYLDVHPQGLVPTLVEDSGEVFTQSLAMIEYLDERYPEPRLIPDDIGERWYVRAISQIIGCEIHPLNNVRVLKYLKSAFDADDAKVNGEWYAHWIAEGFAGLENFFSAQQRHGRYCLGDQVTMADVCLAPQVFNAQRFNCDLSAYPTVVRIHDACMQLAAFQRAEPAQQGDAQ